MSNLSLKTRRRLARGINRRDIPAWSKRNFWGTSNRAVLTLGTSNAQVAYTADVLGTPGNAITVRYVVAGASTPLTVSVASSAITVNVATSAGSAAISTAAQVVNAIQFDAAASALVQAYLPLGSDGSGVVAAVAATNLAGASATPIA